MSDEFLDRLRNDAGQLRFEPDDPFLWSRLSAAIRERVAVQPDVPQLLARWVRPLTASFAALALAAALAMVWLGVPADSGVSMETLSQNSVEINVDGDTFNLAQ